MTHPTIPTPDGLVPAELRNEMDDDEDVGLPAALAAVLLVIGVAAGFLFACWMFAMHLAGKGRLPW